MVPVESSWIALTPSQDPTGFILTGFPSLTDGYHCVLARITAYTNVLEYAANTLNVRTVPLGGALVVDLATPSAGVMYQCLPDDFPCTDMSLYTCTPAPTNCLYYTWGAVQGGTSRVKSMVLTVTKVGSGAVVYTHAFTDYTVINHEACIGADASLIDGTQLMANLTITNRANTLGWLSATITLDRSAPTAVPVSVSSPTPVSPVTNGDSLSTHVAVWPHADVATGACSGSLSCRSRCRKLAGCL